MPLIKNPAAPASAYRALGFATAVASDEQALAGNRTAAQQPANDNAAGAWPWRAVGQIIATLVRELERLPGETSLRRGSP